MGSKVSSHAAGSVDKKGPVDARGHKNDSKVQTLSTTPEGTIIQTSHVAFDEMARFYAHPEVSVISTDPFATSRCYFDRPSAPKVESVTDPTATARCHFDRPSAPEVESVDAEIRAQVLADAIAFKKFVVDYLHPELPVTVTDPSATARCYFDRPSAPEVQSVEDTEIQAQVLADAIAFKKFAS